MDNLWNGVNLMALHQQMLFATAVPIVGGGGGWTPASLTGLIGWWDASVTASMTLSGSNITAMADQSGAGNTFTTFNASPTYNATGLNSKATVSFSGTQGLAKSSFAFGTGNTLTLFAVIILNSSTGAYGRIFSYASGGADTVATSFLLSRDNTTNAIVFYRNTNQASRAVTTGVPVRVIATISSSGVETIYIDGVATTGATYNTAFGSSGTLAVGLAAHDQTSGWIGQMSEVGVATGYSDATTVALLDGYLVDKWALPPPGVTGLIGWWDAKATSSLTLSGSNITAVADRSGAGNNLTTVTGSPTYSATGFNTTKPAIVFTSANHYGLEKTGFAIGTGNTLTVWYVGTFSDGSTNVARMISYAANPAGGSYDWNNAGSFIVGLPGSLTTQIQFFRNSTGVAYTGTAGNHRVICTVNAGAIVVYVDGVSVATGTITGNWASGGTLRLGMEASGNSSWWGGPLAEAGIATGFSDATAVGRLDTYLKNKWGL
jgi:hypothetical protein